MTNNLITLCPQSGFLLTRRSLWFKRFARLRMRCRYQVWLLMAEGNYDEAMRTSLVIFRLARAFQRQPDDSELLGGHSPSRVWQFSPPTGCCRLAPSRMRSARCGCGTCPAGTHRGIHVGGQKRAGLSSWTSFAISCQAQLLAFPRILESTGVRVPGQCFRLTLC